MKPKMESNTASLAVIGVDIGKEVFHLVGLGADGKIALRRKIRRLGLRDVFEKLPPCIVGMEACLSAHFVSRVLRARSASIGFPGLFERYATGGQICRDQSSAPWPLRLRRRRGAGWKRRRPFTADWLRRAGGELDSVAATFLRPIERVVGCLEHELRIVAVFGESRDADRDRPFGTSAPIAAVRFPVD
jgi:hypothetical protein